MAGLVPAIHIVLKIPPIRPVVDARHRAGHDVCSDLLPCADAQIVERHWACS